MPGPAIDMNVAIEEMNSNGTSAGVLWALADHQGTVRDVIDDSGVVQNHIKYNAFGDIESQSDDTVDYRFSYTGREFDSETDLYYYRARYYDADNGRFISEDPKSFDAGDANLYRYVGNNPANGVDPSGMEVGEETVKDSSYFTTRTPITSDPFKKHPRYFWGNQTYVEDFAANGTKLMPKSMRFEEWKQEPITNKSWKDPVLIKYVRVHKETDAYGYLLDNVRVTVSPDTSDKMISLREYLSGQIAKYNENLKKQGWNWQKFPTISIGDITNNPKLLDMSRHRSYGFTRSKNRCATMSRMGNRSGEASDVQMTSPLCRRRSPTVR